MKEKFRLTLNCDRTFPGRTIITKRGVILAERIPNPMVKGGLPCFRFPELDGYWAVECYFRFWEGKRHGQARIKIQELPGH